MANKDLFRYSVVRTFSDLADDMGIEPNGLVMSVSVDHSARMVRLEILDGNRKGEAERPLYVELTPDGADAELKRP